MSNGTRTSLIRMTATIWLIVMANLNGNPAFRQPPAFGPKFQNLETMATGQWWKSNRPAQGSMNLNVPRNEVVAFAVYTHDHGILKLTAQLFPLLPDEPREVRLEFQQDDGSWQETAKQTVIELGWSAHFRIE